MRLEDQLSRSITDRLDRVIPPPADLDGVVRGVRRQRRRLACVVVLSTVALLGGGLLAADRVGGDAGGNPVPRGDLGPIGQLDYSDGLRAYMSPDTDGEIWLGGKAFPTDQLEDIDTDATATSYGMVFFDSDQRANLLREDGTQLPLASPPTAPSSDFNPSSKADARAPLVAWTERGDGVVTVRLYDLRDGAVVESIDVACTAAACSAVVVDGVDRGLVFVRTPDGTSVWDPAGTGDARWTSLGGPDTRVAEVRNRHILYTGPAPEPAAGGPIDGSWSFTEGAIDAQLSHDGTHVLYWSTRLQPTSPDGRPIQLEVQAGDLVFVTFDTDGSVLVAVPDKPLTERVYDCVLPTGSCTELAGLRTESGDPIFVGNDM